jgi:thiosulfate dehydrogenase [quinone] large subunit
MTRKGTYILTAIAAALYVFLTWAFADGLFTAPFINTDEYAGSSALTYGLLALIILAGVYQASKLPESGVAIESSKDKTAGQTDDPSFWKLLTGNIYFAILWLPLRFFIGMEWLSAGEHKLRDDAWMAGGTALKGYWTNAVRVPEPPGRALITYGWYRDFLQYMLDHEWFTWFAKLIAVGEFLIGIGLIVGALVGIAAFFGTLMNFSFMLAGSASTNPVLFGLSVFLVLGWKVAGYFGLDRYLLPTLGAPWKAGSLFHGEGVRSMGTGGTRGKATA